MRKFTNKITMITGASSGIGAACATKHAVKALSKAIKIDTHGSNIRVTSIDPAAAETEFSNVRFKGDSERAKKVYEGMRVITGNDIANVINFCVSCPEHVNINELMISSVDQSTATMINRSS